jgi:hypothetical protein
MGFPMSTPHGSLFYCMTKIFLDKDIEVYLMSHAFVSQSLNKFTNRKPRLRKGGDRVFKWIADVFESERLAQSTRDGRYRKWLGAR